MGSLGIVGAGLSSIGISKDSIIEYEGALSAGKYVVLLTGTATDLARAQTVVEGTRPDFVRRHQPDLNGIVSDARA